MMNTSTEELNVVITMLKDYKEDIKNKSSFEQYALRSISFTCNYVDTIQNYLLNYTTKENVIYVGLDRISLKFILTIKDIREVNL